MVRSFPSVLGKNAQNGFGTCGRGLGSWGRGARKNRRMRDARIRIVAVAGPLVRMRCGYV